MYPDYDYEDSDFDYSSDFNDYSYSDQCYIDQSDYAKQLYESGKIDQQQYEEMRMGA